MLTFLNAWILCGWKIRIRNKAAMNLLTKIYRLSYGESDCYFPYLKACCTKARKESLKRPRSVPTDSGWSKEEVAKASSSPDFRDIKGVLFPRGIIPNQDQLYQLSCIGRALPFPPKKVGERKVDKFNDTITTPPKDLSRSAELANFMVTREHFLIRRFSKDYKRWHSRAQTVGGSACLGYKTRDGGRSRALHDFNYRDDEDEKVVDVKGRISLPSLYDEFCITEFIRDICDQEWAEARAIPVMERGYKVRIVTLNDPYRVAMGHEVRRVLYDLVRRRKTICTADPPPRIPLKESEGMVISLDLETATDTIRHDFLSVLCEALDIPPEFVYDKFRLEDGRVVAIGAFMGLPASWSFLAWTVDFCSWLCDRKGNFRSKGDDHICRWLPHQFRKFVKLLKLVGYRLNKKKTFWSYFRGTFCEVLYEWDRESDTLVVRPSLSLRAVGNPGNRIRAIATLGKQALDRGFPVSRLEPYISLNAPDLLVLSKKRGLCPYLPEAFGGFGWTPSNPSRALTQYEQNRYWTLVNSDGVPIPFVAVGGKLGPHTKRLCKVLAKLRYSTGVPQADRCEHVDQLVASSYKVVSVWDSTSRGKVLKENDKAVVAALQRIQKFAAKHPNYRDAGLTWRTAMSTKFYPAPKSVVAVLPHHKCDVVERYTVRTKKKKKAVADF
jgi:hypothetical protein